MSFKDAALERARKWVYENVPHHSRAAYDTLLATNQDLALMLINKWRELEDLKEAHYALQKEAAKDAGLRFPPVVADAQTAYDALNMANVHVVRWEINAYEANLAMREDPRHRFAQLPYVAEAFHQVFMKEYVPQLWEATSAAFHLNTSRVA